MPAVLRRNFILGCALLSLMILVARPALSQITSLDFGSATVGQSNDRVLTKYVRIDPQTTGIYITEIHIDGPNAADFQIIQDGITGGPYANGTAHSVTIRFTPSMVGPEQATFGGSGYLVPSGTLEFVPVTLTGIGIAPPPPPVTISAAKLGAASFTTSLISGLNCVFVAHYEGQGTGTVTGKWLVDGNDYHDETLILQSLSNGWHVGPTLTIPHSMLLGSHTVQFVINVPGSGLVSTGVTHCAISGFEPATDGWRFNNTRDTSRQGIEHFATDGVCIGMSLIAARAYPNTPIPPDTSPTPVEWNTILIAQLNGNNAESGIGVRLAGYLLSPSRQMSSETALLRNHLADGNPGTMLLFKQSGPFHHGSTSHGVVPFALFDIDNAYITASPDTQENVHSFAIYDPNDTGNVNYINEFELGGTYTMNYGPYVNIASFE